MGITSGERHSFLRILVVDDHLVFRTTLIDVLRREYPKSDLIETGTKDDAWRHLRAYPMDVVFVAMRLPDGDRKSTRLNSSHSQQSRMPSSA